MDSPRLKAARLGGLFLLAELGAGGSRSETTQPPYAAAERMGHRGNQKNGQEAGPHHARRGPCRSAASGRATKLNPRYSKISGNGSGD
jgi:hypothetical protein